MIGPSLETILHRLALGHPKDILQDVSAGDLDYALVRAIDTLEADIESRRSRSSEFRLRLAMHLAPTEALAYERTDPIPRREYVERYLREVFGRTDDMVERLARDVISVLESWEVSRQGVTGHREQLYEIQNGRCAHCKVSLDERVTPVTLTNRDPYKPFYEAPDLLRKPEVDHIDAISTYGTNDISNLQLLCRLCNRGKGTGLGLSLRKEAEFAGRKIEEIDVAHRAGMLYYVIERCGRRCRACSQDAEELTIRSIRRGGGYVRTNLQAICVDCI